jgi:hypothetical protein
MFKIILFVLLALTLSSCNTNESTDSANSKSTKSTQGSNNDLYYITQLSYVDKEIKLNYPQINGLSDRNRQEKINELIKGEAIKVLNYYENAGEEVSLGINYDITWMGTNLLSIQYSGVEYINGAAYPINLFYTTNIDIYNVNKVKLADFVNINCFRLAERSIS